MVRACPEAVSFEDVNKGLETIAPLVMSFRVDAASQQLQKAEESLRCTTTVADPAVIARVYHLRGLIELYRLDSAGSDAEVSAGVVMPLFRLAREVEPNLLWPIDQIGPFGQEIWDQAAGAQAKSARVTMSPSGPGWWLDGASLSSEEDVFSVGRRLVQVESQGYWQGVWVEFTPGLNRLDPTSLGLPSPKDESLELVPLTAESATPDPTLWLSASGWALPFAFLGVEVAGAVRLRKAYAEIGAGAAWGPLFKCEGCAAAQGLAVVFPARVELGVGGQIGDHSARVGAGWQAFAGGSYGTSAEVAGQSASRVANEPYLAASLEPRLQARWPLRARASIGWLVGPDSYSGPAFSFSVGGGWR